MNTNKPTFEFQNKLFMTDSNKKKFIIGIDEVGRGPLAGDIFSCAVFINESDFSNELINNINDSKKLSEKKRESIFKDLVHNKAVYYSIGITSVETIDKINILQATFLSMQKAYINLRNKLNILDNDAFILIDGNIIPPFFKNFNNVLSIINGDSLSISIATASIIAKVLRDKYMIDLSYKFPHYGFDKNKGYGTQKHIDAIKKFGACEIHRKSFLSKII